MSKCAVIHVFPSEKRMYVQAISRQSAAQTREKACELRGQAGRTLSGIQAALWPVGQGSEVAGKVDV